MKRNFNKFFIVGIVFAIVVATVMFVIIPNMPQSSTSVKIGDGVFRARLAFDDESREIGLSGTDSLSGEQALLMVYPNEGLWQVWMKDMKYPIDIVWLNANKEVIYTVKSAQPTGSTNVVFTPKNKAKYVLEFVAGTVESRAIQTGDRAEFQIDEGLIK